MKEPSRNSYAPALAAITSMGTLSQVPMAPSAAAMTAAQAIVAAQALQAHAAQVAVHSRKKKTKPKKTAEKPKKYANYLRSQGKSAELHVLRRDDGDTILHCAIRREHFGKLKFAFHLCL